MKFLYPEGKQKALTFSYDDGEIFDVKLAEILRSHGMKGTFNLNSSNLSDKDNDRYVNKNKLAEIYKGHEIAVHGVEHQNLCQMTEQEIVLEILPDRQALEKLTGHLVQGMAYAFGAYNDTIIRVLKSLGIHYSRTVNENHYFDLPSNFLAWDATCHHDHDLMKWGEEFLGCPDWKELPLMYVWGHSYEFGRPNDWHIIEEFTDMMQGRDEIWYATNGEIYDYITAIKRLEFGANRNIVYNPTAVDIWCRGKDYKPMVIKGGSTVEI
ncbi:MAG: polysaccharide deacetylase family protein [Lachnospiraceae bacterium]|nr:polysaccharide deacetylase family protein [Lachnospiraceae bacterium]